MAIWSRLTGIIAGIGISRSAGIVIEPALEAKRQDVWKEFHAAILAPRELAQLVVSGLMDEATGAEFALRNGLTDERFRALLQLELHAGSLAQVLEIWNRSGQRKTLEPLVDHALAKERIETQYWPHIKDLATIRIPADLLAFAHQRGIVDNPTDPVSGQKLIPVSAPTSEAVDLAGNPSPIRQEPSKIDVLAEFAATGWDFERAAVNARARGLPPAPGELLQLVNRGVISVSEFYAGIGEGDTRNEWRDYLLALRHPPLSAQEYASARLRTWVTAEQSYTGGALTGHTPEQMDLLFLNRGRPASPTQMWTAFVRKAIGPRGVPVEYEDHAKAIAISDIRPEYAEMLWEIKYVYPALFQLNRLVTAKAIDAATAVDWATKNRTAPEVLTALEKYWSSLGGAGVSTEVKSQRTKLLTDVHKNYVSGAATVDQVLAALQPVPYAQADIDEMIRIWDIQRAFDQSLAPPTPGPTT